MKVDNKSIIGITRKSFSYTFRDKRKLTGLMIVLILPFFGTMWRIIPEDVSILHYGSLQVFVYLFSMNLSIVLVSVAWFLSIHRRDFAMQIIAMAALFYGVFLTVDTVPSESPTTVWFDIIVSFCVFIIVCIYLYYIHRNYVNRAIDYKQLHDGIVHDLHHERFMNEISRVEGLIDMAEMEEPYKTLCQKEIAKLRESVTYIAEKYSELK